MDDNLQDIFLYVNKQFDEAKHWYTELKCNFKAFTMQVNHFGVANKYV